MRRFLPGNSSGRKKPGMTYPLCQHVYYDNEGLAWKNINHHKGVDIVGNTKGCWKNKWRLCIWE
ncbi:MAG: hypothetical protein GX421_04065 [Caldisericales bacterium]|nr:hypothetical protein [Caldisericales bacterium]